MIYLCIYSNLNYSVCAEATIGISLQRQCLCNGGVRFVVMPYILPSSGLQKLGSTLSSLLVVNLNNIIWFSSSDLLFMPSLNARYNMKLPIPNIAAPVTNSCFSSSLCVLGSN